MEYFYLFLLFGEFLRQLILHQLHLVKWFWILTKKTIQHLEGGIIEKILVKEGQNVVTNQPLIYLRDIPQSRSQNKMLKKQLITTLAIEERLISERDKIDPDFTDIQKKYQTDKTRRK